MYIEKKFGVAFPLSRDPIFFFRDSLLPASFFGGGGGGGGGSLAGRQLLDCRTELFKLMYLYPLFFVFFLSIFPYFVPHHYTVSWQSLHTVHRAGFSILAQLAFGPDHTVVGTVLCNVGC